MPTQAPTHALRVKVSARATSERRHHERRPHAVALLEEQARDGGRRHQHQQARVGHVVPQRPLRPLAEVVVVRGCRTGRCRTTALAAPTVMMTLTIVRARAPPRAIWYDRRHHQEEQQAACRRSGSRAGRPRTPPRRASGPRRPPAAGRTTAPRSGRARWRGARPSTTSATANRICAAAIETCRAPDEAEERPVARCVRGANTLHAATRAAMSRPPLDGARRRRATTASGADRRGGSGNRRARTAADRTAGTAARRHPPSRSRATARATAPTPRACVGP